MRIEKAVIEQADIIGQVHSEAWKQTYVGVFPDGFLKEYTAERRKHEFLASRSNRDIIYFLIYEDITPVGVIKVVEEFDTYEIASFYMLEKYRSKGYGKQAIAYLRREFGTKRIRLWVLENNTKAIRFYENNGFIFVGNTRVINRGQSYIQLQYELL